MALIRVQYWEINEQRNSSSYIFKIPYYDTSIIETGKFILSTILQYFLPESFS